MAASGASGAGVPSSAAGKPGVDGGASSAGTAGAADASGGGGAGGVGVGVACTGEATYSVTVNITWADGSVAGRHFTTLIGAVHSAALDVWHPGGLATPGVQQMAESGGTQTLADEVQAAIDEGKALSIVKFNGGSPPASSMGQILVNAQFPLVSLGSMMAPTPDNFVGLSSLSLCENGEFIGKKTIDADVYDAGTKNGDGFTYGSGATKPPASIVLAKQFSTAQGTITLQKL